MAANLIMKMSLENNLSPEIKKALADLRQLNEKANGFKTTLQSFKDNKQGILKGSIEADTAELRKLQAQLKRLNADYENAKNAGERRSINADRKTLNADLVSAYNREFTRLANTEKKARAEVNATTASIKKQSLALNKQKVSLDKTTNSMDKYTKSSGNQINTLVRHIRRLESLLVALYALKKGYDVTIGMGHEFNKMMESEKIGLSLIIAGRLKNVDSLGNSVTAMDKWIYANHKAKEVMEDVRKINVSTPHTLEQTAQIYKTMAGQVLAYGGNLEQVKNATRDVSIVSKAMNVDFGQLLKTVDALYSGKMKDSDLKRALQNSVGMDFDKIKDLAKTNKQEAVKYVNEMLAKAKIAAGAIEKSWDGVTSNFVNAWTDIQSALQKPLFDLMKEKIEDITEYLKANKENIIGTFVDMKHAIADAIPAVERLIQLFAVLKVTSYIGAMAGGMGKLATKANLARAGVAGLIGAVVMGKDEVSSFGQLVDKLGKYFNVGFETIYFMVAATVESIVDVWDTSTDKLGAYWDLFIGQVIKATGTLSVPMAKMINRAIITPFNKGTYEVKLLWSKFMDFLGFDSTKPILNKDNLIDVHGLSDNIAKGEKLIQEAKKRIAKPFERSDVANEATRVRIDANMKLLDALDKLSEKSTDNTKKKAEEVKNILNSIDFTDPTDEVDTKGLEKANKEADALLRKYYELTEQKEKLFQMDVKKTLGDLEKGGFKPEQLSKAYDGMWKKYQEDAKKANKKIAMDFTNQFKGLLEGIFDGDFGGAIGGFFDGVATEMLAKPIKELSESMSGGISSMLGGLGSMGGVVGGLAMSGVGMLVDSFFGDEEEPAPELGEIRDTSESMKNALEYIKDAQFPMLTLTREMTGYLQTISQAFGGVENSLLRSGIDIGGSLFQDTYKKGTLFGGKSTSLYGTSIDIDAGTMAELMNGEITAMLDTVTKTVKTKWYGSKKTSYSHNYTDISDDIGTYVADATTALFESLTLAGESLGISTTIEEEVTTWVEGTEQEVSSGLFGGFSSFFSRLRTGSSFGGIFGTFANNVATKTGEWVTETVTSSLADEIIDIGKFDTSGMSAEEVAEEIQGRFSAQMDLITEKYFGVVSEFQRAGEGLGETLFRVITNFDQVGHSMELIGKSVDWRTANIIEEVAGGLDSLNSSMNAYTQNFFTEAEQTEMKLNTLTKSFASLGLSVPKNKAEFRALIEGLDTTTDAGAKLFAEVISLADGFNEMIGSVGNLGTSLEDMIKNVSDAWLGNLSYLTLQQKADFASGYLSISGNSGGVIDTVESAKLAAQIALNATTTKEEYIPIFNRYIKALEDQAPQATTDDVVAELRELIEEVQGLRNDTSRASFQESIA